MSVFLDRQEVRRKRDFGKKLKQLERLLVSFGIVLMGLAAVYGLYQLVFMGQTFAVAKIVVEGKWRHLTAQGLAELSGVKEGDNLFWIKIDDVKDRIKQEPWVESVAVQRRPPNTLWMYVEEHRPVAIFAGDGGLHCVDDREAVFKAVEAGDAKDLPVITGLKMQEDGGIAEDDRLRLGQMLGLMDFFVKSEFGAERGISEIHYDGAAGYSLITKKEPMQILFGFENFKERIENLSRMTRAISSRPGRIQYMLANEPKRVIVRYANS